MRHYLLIVASMLIWSTWGLLIRWLELPAVIVLFYVSLIAGFAVPLVLKARGEFSLAGGGKAWLLFAALAVGSTTNNLTYFYALAHTTVSNAVFTHYTAPVFVAVLAPLLIAERLQRVTLLSLPLATAGMIMIVVSSGGMRLGSEHLPGIIAGTVSGVAYAFLIIVSRKLSQMLLHHVAIIVLLWITILITAPFAYFLDYTLTLRSAGLLLLAGLLHSTVAPLMYFNALRHVIAQHAAILGYMEPLAAIPLAFLFLSETPPPAAIAGGLLILVSGYFIVRSREKTAEPEIHQ